MEYFPYNRASKWQVTHHSESMLRLAGISDVVECRALANEIVQPRKLPDGLLEAKRAGEATPALYVMEVSAYPVRRIVDQPIDDAVLVYASQHVLPEVVVFVLRPRGRYRVPQTQTLRSRQGWAEWRLRWKV